VKPTASGGRESKRIEMQAACTNVPKPTITVADALAALRAAAIGQGDARTLRRALLEVLAAMDDGA
jgi:hypothetical protein